MNHSGHNASEDRHALSTRMTILRFLFRHGFATRDDLAELLQVTLQNISYHLRILEHAGFIHRNHGSRPQVWHPTDQGKALFTFSIIREQITIIIPGLTSITLGLVLLTSHMIIQPNEIFSFTPLLLSGILTSFTIMILNILSKILIQKKMPPA